MRLLFIIDNYPPVARGGFAQLCYDVTKQLETRGHQITLLCASADKRVLNLGPETVIRRLSIPVQWGSPLPLPIQQILFAPIRRWFNLRLLKKLLSEIEPEAILFWPTGYVDPNLMRFAEESAELPVAYYVAGVSPTDPSIISQYWTFPGRSFPVQLGKRLLRPIFVNDRQLDVSLELKHVMCVSNFECQRLIASGVKEQNAVVVYNGIEAAEFAFLGLPSVRRELNSPLRVLYSGRLVEDKGAHTILEAMRVVRQMKTEMQLYLTLLGEGDHSYIDRLHHYIKTNGLNPYVKFQNWIARSDVSDFMKTFDVLVLPTIRPESLARTVQEAMARGLVVASTSTGGSPEIVMDEVTGLLFPPEDAVQLAECLQRFYFDLNLCDQLAVAARQLVLEKFTIQTTAVSIESHLLGWIASSENGEIL